MVEIGCMAHARRKFFDLHVANKSQLAEQALHSIGGLYEVERQVRDMSDEDRWRIRQEKAAPLAKALHDWMLTQRDLVPNGSCYATAIGRQTMNLPLSPKLTDAEVGRVIEAVAGRFLACA